MKHRLLLQCRCLQPSQPSRTRSSSKQHLHRTLQQQQPLSTSKDFPGLAATASAAENGQPMEQLSQPLQQQLQQFSEGRQHAADGTPPDAAVPTVTATPPQAPTPAAAAPEFPIQQQQDIAVQQQQLQQQQQHVGWASKPSPRTPLAAPTTEPSETTATPAEVTPAATVSARVRWGEETPPEQRDASPAIKIMPCTSTDYRLKDKNKQFGEWHQSGAAQDSFARWRELEEQQLQRQQHAATGAAAADQAFNEWCQQQQLRRCPSSAGDKGRHNRSERAGRQASPGRQQLQPPDELEKFLAAQAAAAEARDKGKGKGKGKPPWLPNPWASPTWNKLWADTWAPHYGAGKGMRYRDRSTDHRLPKRQVKTVNPRPCAACRAPYECKARAQTGHGHCTNEKCIRSKANMEKYHGSGARTCTHVFAYAQACSSSSGGSAPSSLCPCSSSSSSIHTNRCSRNFRSEAADVGPNL